ncbi:MULTISPECIES: FeoA family protein [Hallerella]|uniref:Ferrous iron transport protein A n=1 Tax=Hallerella succinigenes TaxID=1896222 RepID=A0A2M9A4W2_9BACT|nr:MULTISPECIES: FeoA family protein [Hallerella]MBS7391226.1 ferrous iron transport protein A [Fibrobacter sp.]MCI6873774.1 ferrous iron transport protein A [Hallerella sp.]MDD6091045.1 FeoA family protein [Hallerella succinigenes]MDY5029511.1 FeoA family protein [Hallerella succinigenes]PJJ40766.1 ferrous iron transport protein A [Hallerella succinigenes]
MPLTFCTIGEIFTVKRLGGDNVVKQHLNELGFSVGTPVTVVASLGGNVIVKVKESRIALDRKLACRIMV